MDSEKVIKRDNAYVLHTYNRNPVVLEKGHGLYAEGPEGQKYLDFTSGIGVNSLGYCDLTWAEAVSEQAHKLQHTSNLYYTSPCGKLAKKLCKRTGMSKVFFGNSGAEANEGAIKVARRWGEVKLDGAAGIVSAHKSFHGRTLATLAATGQDVFHKSFQPLPAGFASVDLNDIDALRDAVENPAPSCGPVCAVMLECVQGEGGVWPATYDYLRAVSDLCHEKGILLVIDEVQTGFFRCGSPFSFQRAGIVPDIVTMAKGIADGFPMGAVAARAEVADLMRPGDHGSTFGGSALAMAACRATLCALVEEDMGEHVIATGKHLRHRLEAMPHVTEVRGRGLMRGAQLDVPVATALVDEGLAEGLVLNHIGDSILRFLPPLCITDEQVDEGMDRLEALLAKH